MINNYKSFTFFFAFATILCAQSCSNNELKYPKYIEIKSLAIENIPTVDTSGMSWDSISNPELRMDLVHFADNYEGRYATEVFDEDDYPNRIAYTFKDLRIGHTDGLLVLLYDKDDDKNVLMLSEFIGTSWDESGIYQEDSDGASIVFTYKLVF